VGNFSRNTFDPLKNYVGVRLQQGVPLVDADWNELNDITRHELYENYNLIFTDGVRQNSLDLFPDAFFPPSSDFFVGPGTALVQGRIVHVRQLLHYSTQPWTNPQRAARDGVAVIPPLTTPMGTDRTDVIYLDVWEREVGNAEDASLINPAIGIETCVRLKREAAVRVAEGTTSLPTAPAGHFFMLLGLLHRQAGSPLIGNIEDRRPFIGPQGSREVSFLPAFLPVGLPDGTQYPAWKISFAMVFQAPFPAPLAVPKFHALKSNNAGASGVLPLILPDGALLTHLNMRGAIGGINGELEWQLLRIPHPALEDSSAVDGLRADTIRSLAETHVFDNSYALLSDDPTKLLVDNSRYYYALSAQALKQIPGGYSVSIHGISIRYRY
jgi:hypothetical protein